MISVVVNNAAAGVSIFHHTETRDTVKILAAEKRLNMVGSSPNTSNHSSFQDLLFHCLPKLDFPFRIPEGRVVDHCTPWLRWWIFEVTYEACRHFL